MMQVNETLSIDPEAPFRNTGCVIMASGLGRRFGGNKLMADFRGEPMIARILTATDFLPHRVVVTRHEDVADYCRERKVPVILHALPYRSDTVRLGLEALPEVDRCFFCPGDQPLLSGQTLQSMALLANILPDAILRPCAEDRPGTPILFPRQFFGELRQLPQGKGGSFLVGNHPEQTILLPVRDPRELMDADTPEALRDLLN